MADSANAAIVVTREDHNWKHEPIEMNSTGGIQRAIRALEAQIKALADYIDGNPTDAERAIQDKAEKPRRSFRNRFEETNPTDPLVGQTTPVVAQPVPNPAVPAT